MPTIAYVDDDEEEKKYTELLFSQLTRNELINHCAVDENSIENDPNLDFLNHRTTTNRELMKQIGNDLRLISEEFEKSRERNRVLRNAQHINISDIDYNEFKEILDGLFSDGITRERIVVLLFFCSDVIVRAYQNKMSNLKILFEWSLNYILERVCRWVVEHGGWEVVLGYVLLPKLIYWFGGAVLGWFVWKKLFKS